MEQHVEQHRSSRPQAQHFRWARRPYYGHLGRYVAVALEGTDVQVAVKRPEALVWVDAEFALTTSDAHKWAREEYYGRP